MQTLKVINAVVAFSLELGMLAAFAVWGYRNGNGLVVKWLLAVALPILVGVLWGFFLAPKAPYRLEVTFRVIVELILFLLAAAALYRTGFTSLAIVFAILSVLCQTVFLLVGEWKP